MAKANGEKRTSSGYKATLKVAFDGLNLSVPIHYEKISSKDIKEQINIITKATDGEVVESKYRYVDVNDPTLDKTTDVEQIATRSKVYFGVNNGKIYTQDEIKDYQIIEENGQIQEMEVSAPTETTKDFEVSDTRSLEAFDNYLSESDYEVWGEDLTALKTLADYLVTNDVCLMFDFQRARTHKPMKGIIKPVFDDSGEWTLVMRLTMTKYNYKHLNTPTPVQKKIKTQNRAKVALAV